VPAGGHYVVDSLQLRETPTEGTGPGTVREKKKSPPCLREIRFFELADGRFCLDEREKDSGPN